MPYQLKLSNDEESYTSALVIPLSWSHHYEHTTGRSATHLCTPWFRHLVIRTRDMKSFHHITLLPHGGTHLVDCIVTLVPVNKLTPIS